MLLLLFMVVVYLQVLQHVLGFAAALRGNHLADPALLAARTVFA
jgi:hypothetical protein